MHNAEEQLVLDASDVDQRTQSADIMVMGFGMAGARPFIRQGGLYRIHARRPQGVHPWRGVGRRRRIHTQPLCRGRLRLQHCAGQCPLCAGRHAATLKD